MVSTNCLLLVNLLGAYPSFIGEPPGGLPRSVGHERPVALADFRLEDGLFLQKTRIPGGNIVSLVKNQRLATRSILSVCLSFRGPTRTAAPSRPHRSEPSEDSPARVFLFCAEFPSSQASFSMNTAGSEICPPKISADEAAELLLGGASFVLWNSPGA